MKKNYLVKCSAILVDPSSLSKLAYLHYARSVWTWVLYEYVQRWYFCVYAYILRICYSEADFFPEKWRWCTIELAHQVFQRVKCKSHLEIPKTGCHAMWTDLYRLALLKLIMVTEYVQTWDLIPDANN